MLGEKEHCLLARICSTHLWEGSKSQYVHQFFSPWFFMPQMIHYIAADQEPGVDWSPMPLHMHTSTAQLPTPHPPSTGYKRFVRGELSSAPDVRDDSIQKPLTLKHSTELLNAGKHGGTCFHASVNMFSPTILIRVSQKVQNSVGHFQNFGRRNVFNSTASLFKRGVSFPPHPLKPA